MNIKLTNGRTVKIDDAVIANYVEKYELTQEDAVTMYLEDEGYLDNAEVEELTKNAKENGVNHDAYATEKKERKPRERKPDPDKEGIISALAEFLGTLDAENVNITNIGKIIEFDFGENHYKIDLIRTRPPKKK